MQLQTKTIHAGVNKDSAYNSIITPIYQTSTFRFEDIGTTKGYDYTRTGNPTRTALEENIAALEGGTCARVIASGMAAITVTLHFFKSGDNIICTNDCYGGTERLLRLYSETFGFEITYVDMKDHEAIQKAIQPKTKAIWIETPSNPLLNIYDIKAICEIAHNNNALAIVDNTFLSPVNQRPLELGADIVVHSTTKYLNGHSDIVGGALITKDQATGDELKWWANCLGLTGGAFDSHLVLRGIRTLLPRMRAHLENTTLIVDFLQQQKLVAKTYYPGLKDHPGHAIAKAQQNGFGAMVSFDLAADEAYLPVFFNALQCFTLAQSL